MAAAALAATAYECFSAISIANVVDAVNVAVVTAAFLPHLREQMRNTALKDFLRSQKLQIRR